MKCEEIEWLSAVHSDKLYESIKQFCETKKNNSTTCLKDKNGNIIISAQERTERWLEYIQELYVEGKRHPLKEELPTTTQSGPEILKEEVEKALKETAMGKTAGPDGISADMLSSLGEEGIVKLKSLFNSIYNTGNIPEEMLKSAFVAIPKKSNAMECSDHRLICLMSHTLKVLLRIILQRIRPHIQQQISELQQGFIPGRGTRNAIFCLRILIERALEVNKDVHLCFVDYNKAFDTVDHEILMNRLEELNLNSRDLRLLRQLYWRQSAGVQIDGRTSQYVEISRGVRQGCVLSPDLFNLYSEYVFQSIYDLPGIKVGGKNINNLRYADDTVLIAESAENLQVLVHTVEEESKKIGLTINTKKTEYMVIKRNQNVESDISIKLENINLNKVKEFKYLGSVISENGTSDREVVTRINIAKKKLYKA